MVRVGRRRAPGRHRGRVGLLAGSLAAACGLVLATATPALADFVGSGTHPWLVVLCNFSNQRLDPAPASYFDQMYGDPGAGSGQYNFEDWWHDASFGQLSVAGTTVADGSHADANGWYTVPETRDTWGYSRDRFGKIVDCENAALPDVNYHNYYGVMAVFPEAQGNTTAALSATDTSVTLNVSSSSPTPDVTTTNYFPTPPFMMNINDGSAGNNETVDVTAAHDNGDGTETFTITRGVNGTTAQPHAVNAGASVPGDFGEVTGNPVGTSPGQSNVTLADGNTYQLAQVILPNETNLTGAQHETGHGFGYSHSRKLSSSTTDYNDSTDIMSAYSGTYEYTTLGTSFGGSVLGSAVNDKGPGLDAIDLDLQHWIPAGRHYAFNNGSPGQQAVVTLHALSDPNALSDGSDPLEARIPASVTIENAAPNDSSGNPLPPTNPPTCTGTGYSCTTSQYYTLEYRQQTGWDSGFPASAVVLHLFGNDSRSYWVDQLPLGHSGLLYAGDEYVDAANSTYIAINSISGSSAQVSLGSSKITPQLTYSGDTSGDYHDMVTLAGDLTVSGAPVPGESVTFTLGTQSCSDTTDSSGHAACMLTINQPSGSYTSSASFTGDTAYAAATGSAAFTITKEETTTTYTGPTVILQGASGVTLQGLLLEDGNPATPIAGRTLTLSLGGQSCTGTTDSTGTASCQLTFTGSLGSQPLGASFAGDAYYLSSVATSQTATLFAFPSTGAFSLGDVTAATATPTTMVTWWADNWYQLNSLSGGIAPSAFKGFAGTVSLPTSTPPAACGSRWVTAPGNSPPPASGVPSYMGVLVTSKVTKSGTHISGNTVHIVVVKVGPGYAPNPQSHGVGTIVATYC
jgi:hypothetical protein